MSKITKISVVVNTRNEGEVIGRCLKSVENWVSEIIVVDMESTDQTVEVAKKLGAKVYNHKFNSYVEPARNFGLRKATGDWILILDPDEEVSKDLALKLQKLAKMRSEVNFYRIPRQNIIFGKWIKHSFCWPDYLIRFFKRGKVEWLEQIHSVPLTQGEGQDLEPKESNAIIHHHYQSISQYIDRLNRYTDTQASELIKSGYKFKWEHLIKKSVGEFLSRFFACKGYKDGLHGLAWALLQSFSELVKYLKVWEKQGFKQDEIKTLYQEMKKANKELYYWQRQKKAEQMGVLGKILLKVRLLK